MDPITEVPTLSEVVIRLQQDRSLSATRRRDLVSGMLRMSEITGVDPRGTPASLRVMRPLINAVRPAKYDLTPKTWSNLCLNCRAALVHPAPRMAKLPSALSHSEDLQRDLDVQYWVMALGSGGHGTASMRGFERSGA